MNDEPSIGAVLLAVARFCWPDGEWVLRSSIASSGVFAVDTSMRNELRTLQAGNHLSVEEAGSRMRVLRPSYYGEALHNMALGSEFISDPLLLHVVIAHFTPEQKLRAMYRAIPEHARTA